MNKSKKFEQFLIDSTGVVHNKKLLSNILNTLKEEIKKEIHNEEHPIGSLEFNASGKNPATYIGIGTWVEWGKGRVPVGVDTSDTDFNEVEKTGGAKTQELRALIGAYDGNISSIGYVLEKAVPNQSTFDRSYGLTANFNHDKVSNWNHTTLVTDVEGNHPVSIQQQYITCYIWKRTA